jgi:hypothetical protein
MSRALTLISSTLLVAGVAVAVVAAPSGAGAATTTLSRAPYLTDASATSVRVNWATLAGGSADSVAWGPAGGSCAATTTKASIVKPFTVVTTKETMYVARLSGLSPATQYCYQVVDGGTPIPNTQRTFTTLPLPTSSAPFSFDVIGDTGYNGNGGTNPDQDRLYASIANSGSSFVVTTGDLAYSGGTQSNYGDLINTGANVSNVFGPTGWPVFGGSTPSFPVLGNHGHNATFLMNWPNTDVAASSQGQYQMLTYPGQAGATTTDYPTAYYAFTVGSARFYLLDADWSDGNVGTSTLYGQDYLNHWQPGDAEYEWLKADLAAHPGGLKFASFHFPLHSDNATEASDTYLQGANALEGLLASNGVDMVFNGHAHMYQRNKAALGNMVSYVTGGGGATLEPTGGKGCTSIDAYSIGWSPTKSTGTACGGAVKPTSASQVYHYLHVTVSGSTVTVAPRNAAGQTFDQVTYDFGPPPPPSNSTLNPSADTYVYSGAQTTAYGSTNPLLVSASSYRGLLRFDTSGVAAGSFTSATLRLYATVGLASGGVQVRPGGSGWTESGTTWANQPAWSSQILATSGTQTSPGWISIPLPAGAVNAGGDTNLGLSYSVASTIERIASREDPSNSPQLVLSS